MEALSLEQRTVRKVMKRILPYVFILYIVAIIDRVNLGYAALDMNADLSLTAETFGLLSGLFFIGYILFEVPSNMILHRLGARIWIARIMITWGIIVILTGWVQSATHLYILRFLLGVAEAGFFPGIVYYMTHWFPPKERGRSYAVFLIAIPAASLVGAPVSTWIMDHISWWGMAGWRWMFILEGIPAVLLGIVTLFYLKDRPNEAHWLTGEEKNWLEGVLEEERRLKASAKQSSLKEVWKNADLWKFAIVYFFNYGSVYGMTFWLPTIINSLAKTLSNTSIGLLAMIPSLIAIPVMVWWGRHSDRTGERRKHIQVSFVVAAIGFFGVGLAKNPWVAVFFLTIAAVGLFSFTGPFLSYLSLFFSESAAAVGIAVVNSVASIGGFIGPTIFGYFGRTGGTFVLCGFLLAGALLLLMFKQRSAPVETSLKG
ncbi:MFS transporter [Bacillaceae bacterium]